jgi:hypothetical protein
MLVGMATVIATAGCSGKAPSLTARRPTTTATKTPAAASQSASAPSKAEVTRPAGWTKATHGKGDPNYAVVFAQDRVNRIKIAIAPKDWTAMQENAASVLGARGTAGAAGGRNIAPGAPGGVAPGPIARGGRGGQPGAPGAPGGNPDMTPVNPMWIPATISFNGLSWTNVGVRYKGNSSLTTAWRSGSAKLPFKLDFDQFEDEHPEIDDQRFYGFKQLSLANGSHDASYMRDALSYRITARAGLVAPRTAFYEIILDHGDGPVSLGVYICIEVVDDTVIARHFGEAKGNIYEADGSAASLAAGTAAQIRASFQKENNEEAADWSDIQALYDALHSGERTSNAAAWRTRLESVLDVDVFLRCLAVNAIIQDWDQYGAMSHNYYLYHDPKTGRLIWIAWDHNEAMSSGGRGDTSLDKAGVSANWPLIRFLLDDAVYKVKYVGYLRTTLTDAFVSDDLSRQCDAWATLLKPYVAQEGNTQAFESAVQQLKAFAVQRAGAVEVFLAQQ